MSGRPTTSAMIASLAAEGRPTRPAPFGHTLARLADARPEIVGLTADLAKYTDLHVFAAAHPDCFYQMGMAEQLLMSAAAGLALEGFTPFATTYAVFASRRAHDFICLAIAEPRLDVKIVCALPGLTTGYGPSHQATDEIAAHRGPVYMRLPRGNVPVVLDRDGYRFELGRAKLVHDGPDALVVSAGFMTMRALEAAERLAGEGIGVSVLHSPTIKPLDEAAILAEARRTSRPVLVAENHSAVGGLGEAVASLLLRHRLAPAFRQIALPDAFLDAGALPTLHDRYGLSTAAVADAVRAALAG